MPISEPSHLALFITSLVGGGAERVTLNLAAALADRGHTLDLLVGRKEGQLHEHIPAAVRIIDLGAADFACLVRAFVRVLATRPARLLILGEGPQREALVSLAHKH